MLLVGKTNQILIDPEFVRTQEMMMVVDGMFKVLNVLVMVFIVVVKTLKHQSKVY